MEIFVCWICNNESKYEERKEGIGSWVIIYGIY